jgi:hypothetical protein
MSARHGDGIPAPRTVPRRVTQLLRTACRRDVAGVLVTREAQPGPGPESLLSPAAAGSGR